MSEAKAAKYNNLISSRCDIVGNFLFVLFDWGVTHYFLSYACVDRLALPTSSLPSNLLVSSSTITPLVISLMCKELDVILGMDWLSSNQILCDCARKILIFPDLEDSRFIIVSQVEIVLNEGA
ncbi:hypothetical protein CR513_20128, partial [Mucuna pruriens]